MRKRTNKQKTRSFPITGLCATLAVLVGVLCLLALLIQKGAMPEEILHPALLLGCLLSAIAGCILSRGREAGRMAQLLSGAVPAILVLCCGIVMGGDAGVGKWALWNAAALLTPCLAAQCFRRRNRQRRRR